ncbi:hypothetical protein [Microbacterium mangrovi]|uniref:hypothetical protein n=1 Tax=Microbacterium mangrovi TaxID=1348253 RepID=UPI00068C055D|nr:hypothetical protein [Microbacterium mangrovi]
MSTGRPRARRVLSGLGAAVLGAVTATVLWLVGLSWAFAVAFGIVAATLAVLGSGLTDADAVLSPRVDPPPRAGQRSDIAQLSWSLRPARAGSGRFGMRDRPVHGAGVRRLRRYAAQRLAGHGLDLADPAHRAELDRVLGPDVVAVLTSRGEDVSLPTINACLDALDALQPPPERTTPR